MNGSLLPCHRAPHRKHLEISERSDGPARLIEWMQSQSPYLRARMIGDVPTTERSMFGYLERQMFKPAPGGYIFQPPPPTRFHQTHSYVINEAQKQEIEAVVGRGRGFWMRTAISTALALAVVTGVLAERYGAPFWLAIFLGFCVLVVAQILGIAFVLDLKLRQLKPLLAGLPRTDERLFPELDRNELLFGRPSPRYIAIWCALFGFLLGQRFELHPPFTDALSTVFLAALAINLFWAFRGAAANAANAEGSEAHRRSTR
jgi:hypothetical protein